MEEDIKILEKTIKVLTGRSTELKLDFEKTAQALENLLQGYKDLKQNSIPKSLVEEEMKRAEKENKPCEEYGRESRNYWINIGKINLSKVLLKGDK